MSNTNARPVDHLVLSVETLEAARNRLTALGFTVAPDGRHPFGTINACVFLADGIYLEPLAIGDSNAVDVAYAEGNAFLAHDRIFRQGHAEGVSAIVTASNDASADHEVFVAAGMKGGKMLEFSRPVRLPDGSETVASFRLAFAAREVEPFFLFTCERIDPLPADRSALESHANGVTGLRRVFFYAPQPDLYAGWWQTVFGAKGRQTTNGMAFDAANLSMEIISGETKNKALVAEALVFTVADLEVTAAVLAANGVAHERLAGGITVPAAPGQGVAFLFEENTP
ncbi:VOC family protein [Agrobacterium vitis]|uniref:VOC family protein n=1 Tax=Agrobacterium vitis TaxID=373 RepID=A0A368NTN1_AGRVI|nr:VOC family protein [Agrobacterium vitis]KAA3516156.1 VOC family protein [Agrobacterium vitis]KAA3525779.1 VOC family protein [Agrobacterium vitis]MCF1478788.1 VOC family protein [Agrobacterium vitis]MUZ95484.1 VOC family protein [Agrobacterium vitis]MVA31741.1 VOC family protein [Agrobacterium vitis]